MGVPDGEAGGSGDGSGVALVMTTVFTLSHWSCRLSHLWGSRSVFGSVKIETANVPWSFGHNTGALGRG